MLKKLLKYDLKYIYKGILPFYIFTIISSLLSVVIFYFLVDKVNIALCRYIWWFLFFATIILTISAVINNITRIWTRFVNNIYKDESYLTHTLPITKNQIYLSKFLASLITMFTTGVLVLIVILIYSYQIYEFNNLKEFLDTLTKLTNNSTLLSITLIFTVVCLEIMNIIEIGFTGILLGYKSNKNKGIKTLLYGFVCYLLQIDVTLLIVYIISLFNTNIKELFLNNSTPPLETIKLFLLGVILLYFLSIIIFYIINVKIFKNGINVE